MNYDESVFKEKANRKARKIWLIFAILLSANYGSDVANGLRTASYYFVFLLLCWLPILIGEILLRIKGFTTELYRYNLVYLRYQYDGISDRVYLHTPGNQPSGFV